MRIALAVIFAGITIIPAQSQQDLFYVNDQSIGLKYNPAYTGNRSINDLVLLTRQQWVGFDGSPKSYLLLSHIKLKDQRAAIGAEISSFSIGPQKETGVFAYYSFTISINEESSLSFGIKAGADLYHVDLSKTVLIDPLDIIFENSTDLKALPNIGTGIHYQANGYFIDLSIPGLLRNKLNPAGTSENSVANRQDRLFIMGGGADYSLNSEITLDAELKLWFVNGAPLLVNLRVGAVYIENIGAGICYRPGGAIAGYAWYALNDILKFGYSYELPSSSLRGPQSGTHEVLVGYNFSFTGRKTLSPRRF